MIKQEKLEKDLKEYVEAAIKEFKIAEKQLNKIYKDGGSKKEQNVGHKRLYDIEKKLIKLDNIIGPAMSKIGWRVN